MNWPNDIHNKRARIGTAIFMTLLLLFIFFFGLTYLNPPPNSGPVINFGFDEQGAGETASSEQVDEPVQEQQQEVTPPPTESTPVVTDEVTTQDVEEAAVVEKKEDPKPPVEQPKEVKDPPKEDPKPSNDLMDRLNKTKNQQDASKNDGNKSGEGVTSGGGDEGKVGGDKNSQSRDGIGGPGDGRLGDGRKIMSKPTPDYPCEEHGRVIVKVYVDKNGDVTRVSAGESIPGGKSSNVFDSCLNKEAEKAAKKTKWQPDPNGGGEKFGYIIYNFEKN